MLEPEHAALVLGVGAEGLGNEARDGLATDAAGLDQAGNPEAPEVPRHERLAQADTLDEVGHARLALRQALDDPQPVHVGQGLVDEPELAQLLGLIDDGREGRPDPGAGRAQVGDPETAVGSTAVYINRR